MPRGCVCLADGAYDISRPKGTRLDELGADIPHVFRLDARVSGTVSHKYIIAAQDDKVFSAGESCLKAKSSGQVGGRPETASLPGTTAVKASVLGLASSASSMIMASSHGEERGNFMLAAENADEFASWVDMLTTAMTQVPTHSEAWAVRMSCNCCW